MPTGVTVVHSTKAASGPNSFTCLKPPLEFDRTASLLRAGCGGFLQVLAKLELKENSSRVQPSLFDINEQHKNSFAALL